MDDKVFKFADLLIFKQAMLDYFNKDPIHVRLVGHKRVLSSEERLALCQFKAALILMKQYGFDVDKIKILIDDTTS